MASYCRCAGEFVNTIQREHFQEKMKTFQNIARFVYPLRFFVVSKVREVRNQKKSLYAINFIRNKNHLYGFVTDVREMTSGYFYIPKLQFWPLTLV